MSPYEAEALELHDHLVDAGWGDAEEVLEIGLGCFSVKRAAAGVLDIVLTAA